MATKGGTTVALSLDSFHWNRHTETNTVLFLKVDLAVLQARVSWRWCLEDVGGVLGTLPDRLLPSLYLRSHHLGVRWGRGSAGPAGRWDAATFQQLVHAHECWGDPEKGTASVQGPTFPPKNLQCQIGKTNDCQIELWNLHSSFPEFKISKSTTQLEIQSFSCLRSVFELNIFLEIPPPTAQIQGSISGAHI